MIRYIFVLLAVLGINFQAVAHEGADHTHDDLATKYNVKDPENALLLKTMDGDVVIEMYPNKAPNHVAKIKKLVRDGFYDGLKFHRVIEGFMAQTGCPHGTGTGGSGQKINQEFNDTKHVRGTVSMARSNDPNSADSQFFIVYETSPWLDNQYTAWGEVVSGMEFVDAIKKGAPGSGSVTNPDKIFSVQVISDLK